MTVKVSTVMWGMVNVSELVVRLTRRLGMLWSVRWCSGQWTGLGLGCINKARISYPAPWPTEKLTDCSVRMARESDTVALLLPGEASWTSAKLRHNLVLSTTDTLRNSRAVLDRLKKNTKSFAQFLATLVSGKLISTNCDLQQRSSS